MVKQSVRKDMGVLAPSDFKGKKIVRLAATDIYGHYKIRNALRRIKGISHSLAHYICTDLGIDKEQQIGMLSEDDIKKIEEYVNSPKVPSYNFNRQKDIETGENVHLIGTKLDFRKREDIHFMRKIRCYKGIRHETGQPVRGQRTRSTFRTQKTVGVVKKKQMPAKGGGKK